MPSPGTTCHSFCLGKCCRTGALTLSFTTHHEIGNILDVEIVIVSFAQTTRFRPSPKSVGLPNRHSDSFIQEPQQEWGQSPVLKRFGCLLQEYLYRCACNFKKTARRGQETNQERERKKEREGERERQKKSRKSYFSSLKMLPFFSVPTQARSRAR